MSDQVDKLRAVLQASRAAAHPVASTALVPAAPPAPIAIEHSPARGGDHRITEAGLEQIRRDRANGLSLQTIAKRLGMSSRTFGRVRQADPRVEEALVIGHAACEDELVDVIMKKARYAESDRDSLIAAMFMLKARHGYRDTGALDGGATTVNVQVNQIESMTTEQMRRRVAELMAERERVLTDGNEETQAQDAEVVDAK